jgi:predicted SAM-dependent methyltransferase
VLVRGCLYYAGLFRRPYLISSYFQHNAVRKLQIGSDVWLLPGWLNTDLYPKAFGCITLDATKPFPFPSASFDYIFSEHQMEHIAYSDAAKMLRECHRALRPRGKLRIALPCMDRLVGLFASSRSDVQQKYIAIRTAECYPGIKHPSPCFAINAAFMNWGHRFLYDRETLQSLLQEIGYTEIQFFAAGQSDDCNFTGIEMRTSEIDLHETMVVQAVRAGIQ